SMKTLLLSQDEIKELITMKDVVEACDKTFQGMGDGTVVNPTKVNLDLGETAPFPPYSGFMNAMPAYVGWSDTAGIKWAGGFLGERKKAGLPYITSLIMLINPQMGNFTAVLDGSYITNMRTGAQTAVSLKYLYPKKSLRLSLYGAGMQGHTQTMAISELFDLEEVRVYDISKASAERYASDMEPYVKGKIHIAETPEEAADGGDVAVCVTQSKEKFFKNEWFKPGKLLFPMGSYQECDNDCILNADKIIVDHIGQTLHRGALAELGIAGRITEKDIYSTIGELAAGKKKASVADGEKILCIPIGTGAMDIGVASVVLERARKNNIGGTYEFV
ncbi:MAG: ornithine cyclodeaminase family protein, partial [Aminobacterium sp.]